MAQPITFTTFKPSIYVAFMILTLVNNSFGHQVEFKTRSSPLKHVSYFVVKVKSRMKRLLRFNLDFYV